MKFIKLTMLDFSNYEPLRTININVNFIIDFYAEDCYTVVTVYYGTHSSIHSSEYYVSETPEQIIALINDDV